MPAAVTTTISPPRAAAFTLGDLWWACWGTAYGARAMRAIDGLRLIPEPARRGPLLLPVWRSATNPHSVCYDLPPDAEPDADLPARLFAHTRAACLRFDYLAPDARLLAAAARWDARYRVDVAPHALAPTVDCRLPYADWFAGRSKRVRHLLRKSRSDLIVRRGMRLELVRRDPTTDGLLDAMLRLERSGWKGRERSAIHDSPADTMFYTRLAQAAAAAKALQLALLWDADRLVAFEYGVIGGDRLFLLKVGYDEADADASPGHLLAAWHIEQCGADPAIAWYDKMGNGMTPAPYKLRFADGCATRYRLTVYAPTALGRLARLTDRAQGWARAQAKAGRAAWRGLRGGSGG